MLQIVKNKAKRIVSSIAAGVLLFSQFAVVPAASANQPQWPTTDPNKISICHAASAITNPYQAITVDKSAADGLAGNSGQQPDHYSHNDPVLTASMVQGDDWGDIIPPIAGVHNGLNWTVEGQAIWNNGCSTKGSIKVVKDSQPNSTDDFDFAVKRGSTTISTFELEDDGDNNDGQKNYELVDNLAAGNTYSITENPDASDWTLNGATCDAPNYTADAANRKITLTLGLAQHVTCTFTNVPTPTYGSVKVNKKVDLGSGTYTSANGNGYPFRWGIDNEPTNNLMGTTQTDVAAGIHTVSENLVNGYEFAGWYVTADEYSLGLRQVNCNHPQGTTLPVTITVEKNKTKEVTFCNKAKKGSITIIKDAQPDSHQNFDFTINQKANGLRDNFELEDDGDNNDQEKNYKTFDSLPAGEYVVTEAGEDGWKLTDIACSQGATVVTDKTTGRAIITLGQGENVTCTFVNQKKGKIAVHKHTNPAGDKTEFNIEATTANGTIYSDATRKIADGETEYFWVGFGSYDVTETVPAGWAQTNNTCVDVVIDAQNVYAECHIYNTKAAELTIIKHAYPQDGQDFEFTSPQLGNFTLDVDGDPTHEAFKRFTGLGANTYSITEEVAGDNWKLTDLYCDTNSANYEVLADGTLNITLSAGDDIACYFINVKQNSIVGHKFNDNNGNRVWDQNESALAGWTIKLTKECDADAEAARFLNIQTEEACSPVVHTTVTDANGAYAFSGLDSGTYTVCEVQQTNWTQTYPQENNGCHIIVIDCQDQGQVFTANFGNKAKPQILGSSTIAAPKELVKTGASTAKSVAVGLSILSALAALHFLTSRRKDYAQ